MTPLPTALEPWAPWLTLFPPELAEAMGQLLLQLHPLVGSLNTATLRTGDEPAGLGNIIQRGNYERLLISEWAYADAEPDEFLRRACSGELLFTGPEPAQHQRSLRSVVLFDAGPAQLGEPRLAHLALFILLARRALQAGAQFQWGIWQQPGALHETTGLSGLQALLKARTLATPENDVSQQWQAALGNELQDCWLIGAVGMDAPKQASASIVIRRSLLADQLSLTLRQRRASRTLSLNLPATSVGVRLIRRPFEPLAHQGGTYRHAASRPSRAQPPRFGLDGNWIAVAQLDGGVANYHVPSLASTKPGKHRLQPAPQHGAILAAGMFKPYLSYIRTEQGELEFHGFPGPLFSQERVVRKRPPMEEFRAPPGMGRWLPAFFLISRSRHDLRERVLTVDTKKQLVCWEATPRQPGDIKQRANIRFSTVARDVIGIAQLGQTLLYACADSGGIQLHHWSSDQHSPAKLSYLAHNGTQLLFGDIKRWGDDLRNCLVAIQRDTADWWLGDAKAAGTVMIDDGATVLGVTRSHHHSSPGLVVLHPGHKRFELRVPDGSRYKLAASIEEIQQASFDPASRRLAWVTARSRSVIVHSIHDDRVLLRIAGDGEKNEQ